MQQIIHPDTTDYSLHPTPIRPEGVRVVEEVPVTESILYKDGTLYSLLSWLVRKRKSEEMGPVRPIFSCFDDMRATNTAIESDDPSKMDAVVDSDPSKMHFRDTWEEPVFPATKRIKTMHRATPSIPLLHTSSFANIFDPEINITFQKEQALPEASKISSLTSAHRNSITRDDSHSQDELQFREYQSTRWSYKFEELNSFHQIHGHCQVGWKENPLLAQWIKRQRYQYKLKQAARHSTMTDERVAALERLGLTWESHRVAWEEKFNELVLFKAERGHCSVRSTFPENPQLSIWVKGQRRQLKLFQSGKISSMDAERTAKLNDIGFCWSLRKDAK
jgi:hypothetical protein